MAYSGRHRYKSRRERYAKTGRDIRIVAFFAAVALFVLLIKNRWDIYAWIKTFFY